MFDELRQSAKIIGRRGWKFQREIDPPAHRGVEHVGEVGREDDERLGRELVELNKDGVDDRVAFAVDTVPALRPRSAQCVGLIKEQHAWFGHGGTEDVGNVRR
ncbi:MAG: hypothetical protein R3B90_21835 [Planctomycetaceae bacterium]